MTTLTTPTVSSSSDLTAIFQDGLLIDLTIGYWGGKKHNTHEDLGLSKSTIPGFVKSLGTKQLLPDDVIKSWESVEAKARRILDKHSRPFPIGDAKFVPRKALAFVEAQLEDVKREFWTAVESFMQNYDTVRQQMLDRYPEHRAHLATAYPTDRTLRRKFKFTWTVFSVTLPASIRLERYQRDQQEQEDAALARYRQHLDTELDQFLTDAVTTLREETVQICTKIAGKIQAGEVITERSLESLRTFIDRFKTMNFVGDTTVEQQLDHIRTTLLGTVTAAHVRTNADVRTSLGSALTAITAAASQISDIDAITGGYRRRLHLVPKDGMPLE